MLGSGRQVLSAPKGAAIPQTAVGTATASAETVFWYGGDTKLAVALTAGAVIAAADMTVVSANDAGIGGFANSSSVIIEPGTPREEVLVLHTTAKEGSNVLGLAAQTIKYNHAIGSRVVGVVSTGSIRPGSLVIVENASGSYTAAGIDDGNGNIIATVGGGAKTCTGTVDYTTGTFKVTFGSSPGNGKAVAFTANSMPVGDADITDFTGQGFFKNHMGMRLNRRDVPDEVAVINLGDSEVGVFMQKSMNKGKSFVTVGGAVKLPPRGRKIITPGGGFYDQLRIRACSAVDTVSAAGARTANSKEAAIVEVTPLYSKLDNGQA